MLPKTSDARLNSSSPFLSLSLDPFMSFLFIPFLSFYSLFLLNIDPLPPFFFSLFLTLSLSSLPCGILYFHFVFFLRLSLSCFLTFYASFVSFIHPPPHPFFFSFIKVYLFARLSFIVKDIFSFFFLSFLFPLKPLPLVLLLFLPFYLTFIFKRSFGISSVYSVYVCVCVCM